MFAAEFLWMYQLRHLEMPSSQAEGTLNAVLTPKFADFVQVDEAIVKGFDENVDGHSVTEGGGEVVDDDVRMGGGGLQAPLDKNIVYIPIMVFLQLAIPSMPPSSSAHLMALGQIFANKFVSIASTLSTGVSAGPTTAH
jgi:hypothetical protein